MKDTPLNNLTPSPSPKERGTKAQLKASPGYVTGDSSVYKVLAEHAKQNRKEPTEAERLLWEAIRNRKTGSKFRRQHPVGRYIVDFVCLEKKLIIEVDGEYHHSTEQKALDEAREFELEQKHLFKVLRFTNQEVLINITATIEIIRNMLLNIKS